MRPRFNTTEHFKSMLGENRDLSKAIAYRDAELPFILYNNPAGDEVVRKWAQPNYLEGLLGSQRYRTEVR
jgi:hypothetical protein